jgi:hypothetical protein
LLGTGCHIILRGRWCDSIVLNVQTSTKDKCDVNKGQLFMRNKSVHWIHTLSIT